MCFWKDGCRQWASAVVKDLSGHITKSALAEKSDNSKHLQPYLITELLFLYLQLDKGKSPG